MNLELDINNRLQWYLNDTVDDLEYEINYFNPLDIINSTMDLLDITKNYICQRQNNCKCKKDCCCDNDDYFKIDKFKSDLCSNNKYIFQLFLYNKFNLSKKQPLRIFTLDSINNETPMIDIKFKEKDKERLWYINFLKNPEMIFPLQDDLKIDKTTISFSIDFMNYVKL